MLQLHNHLGRFFWALLPLLVICALPAPAYAVDFTQPEISRLTFGMLIGVLLAATCYLFFIFLVVRDGSQVSLILMLFFLMVHLVSANVEVLQLFGLDENQAIQEYLQNTSLLVFFLAALFFTAQFLNISDNLPGISWLIGAAMVSILVLMAGSGFLERQLINFMLPTIGAITIGLVLIVGMVALFKDIPGARIHLLSFSIFLLGGMAQPLAEIGLVTSAYPIENMLYLATALSAILFAVVVSGQFTARQEASAIALARTNERFSLVTDGTNEGLFDFNFTTGEIFFSSRFQKLIGRNLPTDRRGIRNFLSLLPSADRIRLLVSFRRWRKSKGPNTIALEFRLKRPDGKQRWGQITAVRPSSTEADEYRVVGSLGDVTAKKVSELALKQSEARFRTITEAHPVPVIIVRIPDGVLLYASPGCEPLLGFSAADLQLKLLSQLIADTNQCQTLLQDMRELSVSALSECQLYTAAGEVLPAAISARRAEFQNMPAAVLGLYDLSERKAAEAKIAKQQEALQQSEKMAALGGLLAGVAHELNNPLSVIVGQATLLGESAVEDKTKNRADKIAKAAERCSRIVKSFLSIARRKPPQHQQMQLNDIVPSALDLLAYQLRNENVQLIQELAPTLPSVIGDHDQMVQVITNLVLNGVQAMQGWVGKKQIVLRSWYSQEDYKIRLAVADSGPGVPAELRKRIFEPFFTTKAPGTGTGVGLSLCLNIVESHGGNLELTDTPGGGATFTIVMPVAIISDQVKNIDAVATAPLPPLKILLVDDEPELAQTLADLLQPHGHTCDFAINGAIALEKLQQQSFDMIISDLRMPVMDGPTFYANLTGPLAPYTHKILFVTGDTLTPHVRDFIEKNPIKLIEKPYTLADIRGALALLLPATAPTGQNSAP